MAEPSLDEFEQEVRGWLDANARRRALDDGAEKKFVWGEGSDDVSVYERVDREKERQQLERSKAWRAKKYDAGYGWISGPPEYGGRGFSSAHDRVFQTVEGEYDVPSDGFFTIGLGMVALAFLEHGTKEAKDELLPKMFRGDLVGCQLFSEPGAGSDAASVQSRAVRDGDEWVLNGQKVWNTGGHYSDVGLITARTDPDQPKHKGITCYMVDMHAPGVEVRPLRQMTGGASFNEVFLTDVRVHDRYRVGEVNEGWRVAITTLMNERAAGTARSGGTKARPTSIERLSAMLRNFGLAEDPVFRDELMQLHINQEVADLLGRRLYAKVRGGVTPGPELSMTKLFGARNTSQAADFVAHVLGPRLTADTGEWGTFAWSQFLLSSPSSHIAGGSDQILQNILGERVLGLPKDPGIDSTTPFRELRVGTQRS